MLISNMKNIAFVTSSEDPELIKDDQLAVVELQKLGYAVAPLVWDSENSASKGFDALIFRSCWNYHRKFADFQTWLEAVAASRVPTFNSLEIMKWNLHKGYLIELAGKGAPVPKTVLIHRGQVFGQDALKQTLTSLNSDAVVIKPAVSLNGHDTYLIPAREIEKLFTVINKLSNDRDVLIQEYVAEIKTSGEVSLVFFNNEFSHAIRKTPASGEFRVHVEYGGNRFPFTPPADLIDQAQAILNLLSEVPLFARVDFVETSARPKLIELEVIDPMLFLGYAEGAPWRFAQAIGQRLK